MSLETLILLLAVGFFLYANLIQPWRTRRRRQRLRAALPERESAAMPERVPAAMPQRGPAADTPPRDSNASQPAVGTPATRGAPTSAPIGPRGPARLGLGAPADLRRAVILATILGPCRALEDEPREAHRGAPDTAPSLRG
jgi:hypothetical protein